jgi:hypothetical protein
VWANDCCRSSTAAAPTVLAFYGPYIFASPYRKIGQSRIYHASSPLPRASASGILGAIAGSRSGVVALPWMKWGREIFLRFGLLGRRRGLCHWHWHCRCLPREASPSPSPHAALQCTCNRIFQVHVQYMYMYMYMLFPNVLTDYGEKGERMRCKGERERLLARPPFLSLSYSIVNALLSS